MKLEYLDDICNGGKYPDVITNQLIRLYDFDNFQANKFRSYIQAFVEENKILNLKEVDFIEVLNCNLTLRLSNTDIGITTSNKKDFFCDLSPTSYKTMISLLEPFCNKTIDGYQWLYDIDNEIEFLFSPSGTW
jgi:hypothetical protein